jgi:hypothetical protein
MTYWHESKTKKYHDLANRIAEKGFTVRFFAFEDGCRVDEAERERESRERKVIAQIPHCIGTSEEDYLTDCAITTLKCSRKIFLSRSSFNFEPPC